jgi:hypothetical protein
MIIFEHFILARICNLSTDNIQIMVEKLKTFSVLRGFFNNSDVFMVNIKSNCDGTQH